MQVLQARMSKLSDIQLLGRLNSLTWLSATQMKSLNQSMAARDLAEGDVIFEEKDVVAPETHILLSGVAQMSHISRRRTRGLAILAPGVIFRAPLMPRAVGHHFRWTALNACRVAQLSTERFIDITLGIRCADLQRIIDGGNAWIGNMLARYPSFIGFNLLHRVAMALLELAREVGVLDTRGVLLRIIVSQRQLADLVGASRAKVGRVLAGLERRKLVVREGRQLAIAVAGLEALVQTV